MECVLCHSSVVNKTVPLCEHCKSNPFKVERARDIFARNKKFHFLKKTYSQNFGEIPNINSPDFWDKLLFSTGRTEEKSPITKDRINTVIRIIRPWRGKLLDVGFGYGFIEKGIPRDTFDLYGIEISHKAVKRIKKITKGNFKMGSILEVPFQNEFFDVVLALEVLEHISPHNTFKALGELKRVLKKQGMLLVSVPLNEELEEMYEKELNPNGHVRVYTPELIKTELKIVGFKIQKELPLFAFKTFYELKKVLQKTLFRSRWRPNDIVILAQKP